MKRDLTWKTYCNTTIKILLVALIIHIQTFCYDANFPLQNGEINELLGKRTSLIINKPKLIQNTREEYFINALGFSEKQKVYVSCVDNGEPWVEIFDYNGNKTQKSPFLLASYDSLDAVYKIQNIGDSKSYFANDFTFHIELYEKDLTKKILTVLEVVAIHNNTGVADTLINDVYNCDSAAMTLNIADLSMSPFSNTCAITLTYFQAEFYKLKTTLLDLTEIIAQLYNRAGMVYYRIGEWDKAIHNFKLALIYNDNHGVAAYNIACCYALKGDKIMAKQFLFYDIAIHGESTIVKANKDSDFKSLHTEKWFADSIPIVKP